MGLDNTGGGGRSRNNPPRKGFWVLKPNAVDPFGVEVMSKQRILLSQRKYVLDMLSEKGKLGAKPCSTPMVPNVQLTKEGELFKDLERYKRLVWKLNYLLVTCSDAYSVSGFESVYVISHNQSLGRLAVEHILCYLKEALIPCNKS